MDATGSRLGRAPRSVDAGSGADLAAGCTEGGVSASCTGAGAAGHAPSSPTPPGPPPWPLLPPLPNCLPVSLPPPQPAEAFLCAPSGPIGAGPIGAAPSSARGRTPRGLSRPAAAPGPSRGTRWQCPPWFVPRLMRQTAQQKAASGVRRFTTLPTRTVGPGAELDKMHVEARKTWLSFRLLHVCGMRLAVRPGLGSRGSCYRVRQGPWRGGFYLCGAAGAVTVDALAVCKVGGRVAVPAETAAKRGTTVSGRRRRRAGALTVLFVVAVVALLGGRVRVLYRRGVPVFIGAPRVRRRRWGPRPAWRRQRLGAGPLWTGGGDSGLCRRLFGLGALPTLPSALVLLALVFTAAERSVTRLARLEVGVVLKGAARAPPRPSRRAQRGGGPRRGLHRDTRRGHPAPPPLHRLCSGLLQGRRGRRGRRSE